jgi:enoyl-CoA hydratase/carnithine racemase
MTGQITLRPWSAQPQHAGIWRVGIDHPGKLNAMSRAMWVALRETLQAVNARSDVRCLVVQGEGAAFALAAISPSTRAFALTRRS